MRKIGLAEYGLMFALGVFVLLKIIYSFPRFSDGNAYMYMAKLVAGGAVPYRDFFLASPPLIVYVFALFGKIFGFSWRTFNYLPVSFSVVDGLVIYTLFRNVFGKLARLSAVIVYLFSFTVLSTTDFYSGIHLALTLALLGVLAMVRRWPLLAGLLFSLAVLGKLYMIVIIGALVVYMLFRQKWLETLKILIGFVAVTGVVYLIFWALAGSQFWNDIFLNHLDKVEGIPKGRVIKFFVLHDWWLLLAVPLSLYWRRWMLGLIALPIIFWGIFLMVFPNIYYVHFKLLVVWLALLWGWNIMQMWKRWPGLRTATVAVLLLAAIAGTGVWQWRGQQAEAAVITDVGDMVKSIARLTEGEKPVYGDYTLVPLLALEANRPIFGDYIDVNPMYFDAGIFDYARRGEELKEAGVNTIITKGLVNESGRLLTGPETVLPLDFFSKYCRMARTWPIARDYSHNAVIIWRCEY
ncbi:MAG: glycosyltransferase family 39 protein [bacterium]